MRTSFALLLGTVCAISTQVVVYGQTQQRTFVDDAGIVHVTDKANPTFMASARTSIALMHQFGYDDGVGIKGQLLGSYGPYRPRGSQMDLENKNAKPKWPSDPTSKEVQFLKDLPYNFSPDCYDNNQQCKKIELEIVKEANPDVWIYINNGVWFTGNAIMKPVVDEVLGGPPIFIDTNSYGEGCVTYNEETASYVRDQDKCSARSLLDVIERTNELASFLGIQETKKNVDEDKNLMCFAAKQLSRAARSAQEDGLRVMAANAFINPILSGSYITLSPIDPLSDAYLRTFEELGVPILHPGKYEARPEVIPMSVWFPNCEPRQDMIECNDEAFYPIDLWLMEGRRLPNGTKEEEDIFLSYFPEKALLSSQYAHWPMNDGPISYRAVARTFHYMAGKLKSASRVYPKTKCTNIDVTAESYLKRTTGGLYGGGYACFNKTVQQQAYLTCPDGYDASDLPIDDDSLLFYDGSDGEGDNGGSGEGRESSSYSITTASATSTVAIGFFIGILFSCF